MRVKYILSLFTILVLSLSSVSAQEKNTSIVIPVEDGKVLFTDTIPLEITTDETYSKLGRWLGEYSSARKVRVKENDKINKQITFSILENMEMEKKTFSLFHIYMQYVAQISYKNGLCIIKVGDIKYIEPEELKKETPYVMDGENILLKDEYKVIFVTDAAEKVKEYTVKNMEGMFKSLRDYLNK